MQLIPSPKKNQVPGLISVVVTLFNEEDNIQPLISQVSSALDNHPYELILVDDGSTDATAQRIRQYANAQVKMISFATNFGQTQAMSAGIMQAAGDFIVTMDGDLQNDPSDIPHLITILKKSDCDVVAGRRMARKDGWVFRKIPSRIANLLIRTMTGVKVHDYGCSLRAYRAPVAKSLELYGELHRFIPVLIKLQGAKMIEVAVKHHPRVHGQSKYGLGRILKVMSDLLLILFLKRYLQRPIHIFGGLGLVSIGIGSLIYGYLFLEKIFGADIWGRPLLIVGLLLLLGGLQSVFFGVIAELLMRTYYESQGKKTYRVKEVFQMATEKS